MSSVSVRSIRPSRPRGLFLEPLEVRHLLSTLMGGEDVFQGDPEPSELMPVVTPGGSVTPPGSGPGTTGASQAPTPHAAASSTMTQSSVMNLAPALPNLRATGPVSTPAPVVEKPTDPAVVEASNTPPSTPAVSNVGRNGASPAVTTRGESTAAAGTGAEDADDSAGAAFEAESTASHAANPVAGTPSQGAVAQTGWVGRGPVTAQVPGSWSTPAVEAETPGVGDPSDDEDAESPSIAAEGKETEARPVEPRGAEASTLREQGVGLLASVTPFRPADIERALDNVLEQIGSMESGAARRLRDPAGWIPFVLFASLGVAAESLRRKLRAPAGHADAEADPAFPRLPHRWAADEP